MVKYRFLPLRIAEPVDVIEKDQIIGIEIHFRR